MTDKKTVTMRAAVATGVMTFALGGALGLAVPPKEAPAPAPAASASAAPEVNELDPAIFPERDDYGRCWPWSTVTVTDGDSVHGIAYLGLDEYRFLKVRIEGIDAPEQRGVKKDSDEYAEAVEATSYTFEFTRGDDLRLCSGGKRGKYGRLLGDLCPPEGHGKCLSQALLDEDLAVPYDGGRRR